MNTTDIRIIKSYQESGRVFFHLKNGKTVVRTMDANHIRLANTIGNRQGEDARIEEYVRLFNELYSEPQVVKYNVLSYDEKRFFYLHKMREVFPLPEEEESEYQRLLNESI